MGLPDLAINYSLRVPDLAIYSLSRQHENSDITQVPTNLDTINGDSLNNMCRLILFLIIVFKNVQNFVNKVALY